MIKELLRKLLYGYKSSSDSYITFLRKCGVEVGKHVEIFCPKETVIETRNPHLLTIGSYVSMTGPVTILNHDYSVCVLKKYTRGEILGKQKKTQIGDNVFLGWGCCILPGTKIGNNTIIGAYSVVSGTLEDNAVYAGNPARRICSIEEYYDKVKDSQLSDACTVYIEYKKRCGVVAPKELFHEYFYLFEGGDYDNLPTRFKSKFQDHGNLEETIEYFRNHKPMFSSYSDFCVYAEKEMNDI